MKRNKGKKRQEIWKGYRDRGKKKKNDGKKRKLKKKNF